MRGKIDLIVRYVADDYKLDRMVSLIGGEFEGLGNNFGIITMSVRDINKIATIRAIEEVELPKTLYGTSINHNYEPKKDCLLGVISSSVEHSIQEENDIVTIKATVGKNINHTKSTVIMKWIKYLVDKKRSLEKELIIYVNFCTKYGIKKDDSLLFKYINSVIEKDGIEFIFPKKHNGNKTFLKKGKINKHQTIVFEIKEKGATLQLYKDFLNNYTIEITNTYQESSDLIRLSKGYTSGTIGENIYHIYNTGPKAYNIDGEIVINIMLNDDEMDKGLWKLNIFCEDEYRGEYAIM